MPDAQRFDIVIVGGGPAGINAALMASTDTSSIAIIDQNAAPGGQIWRRDVADGSPDPRGALALEYATFIGNATVIDAVTIDGRHRLVAERDGGRLAIESATVILATGARELFLPFPGWTLPGVVGAGGLQALMKSGLDVRDRRIVIAGSGPLLLPVAATAVTKGADVVAVVEQASLSSMARFSFRLAAHPVAASLALRYVQKLGGGVLQYSRWVSAAHGRDRLESVSISGSGQEGRIDCDLLATSYGLVPNVEVARQLGCEVRDGAIVVDDRQRTSVEGVYAAGECTGVGGLGKALADASVAASAASGDPGGWGARTWRNNARRWGQILDRTFAPRPEVLALAAANTIVCRCEDVRLRDIDPTWSTRQAKLYTRAGMGACQGRVCGAALQHMFGWTNDTVRAPLQPAALSSLLGAS